MSFVALLGIGFVAVAVVITSLMTNYSIRSKENVMYQTAKVIYNNIAAIMKSDELTFSQAVEDSGDTLKNILEPLSVYSESAVIVTDETGRIIFLSGNESSALSEDYTGAVRVDAAKKNSSDYRYSSLSGLFKTRRFNYIYPVLDGTAEDASVVGRIILSSPGTSLKGMYEQIIRVIIIASLWIFFAAVIAVYFITDRIITPLKEMSSAAKSYSKGDFSVRVPVQGTDEIAELAMAFNHMAESLTVLETSRNTFLSSVSHDLRTPMTSIQGFVDGILDGTIPKDKQSYYLNIVSVEVKRLSRLVSSLLDISRMESGNLKLTKITFDICEVARLILISFEEKIDAKKLNIEFETDDDPSCVFADRDSIHQILYNLIDNAIKFTYDNGLIKIEIRNNLPDKYTVSVYNTGLGIKKEEQPMVFDRFFKSDSSRGLDKTGTGLGLYIAKTKLEAHGEKISVESEYGKYCRFEFTLAKTNEPMTGNKGE